MTILVAKLESLQSQVPDDALPKVRRAFANQTQLLWLESLQLAPDFLQWSEDEINILENYLYANGLMLQCKEAAVRVTPQVWQGIEGRMLTVKAEGRGQEAEGKDEG